MNEEFTERYFNFVNIQYDLLLEMLGTSTSKKNLKMFYYTLKKEVVFLWHLYQKDPEFVEKHLGPAIVDWIKLSKGVSVLTPVFLKKVQYKIRTKTLREYLLTLV